MEECGLLGSKRALKPAFYLKVLNLVLGRYLAALERCPQKFQGIPQQVHTNGNFEQTISKG